MAKHGNRWSPKARGKRNQNRSRSDYARSASSTPQATSQLRADELVGLVIDLWRMQKRAEREEVPERFLIALERALERVYGLGFEIKELKNERYDPHMKVTVVENTGGNELWILECLTPAVYYKGKLIERANVIIGGHAHGKTDG